MSISAEGEQQEESGTGEGAKRAIGNLPSQPSVIKVKSFYINWKCKWNSNDWSVMKRNKKRNKKSIRAKGWKWEMSNERARYEQIDVKMEKENGQ